MGSHTVYFTRYSMDLCVQFLFQRLAVLDPKADLCESQTTLIKEDIAFACERFQLRREQLADSLKQYPFVPSRYFGVFVYPFELFP